MPDDGADDRHRPTCYIRLLADTPKLLSGGNLQIPKGYGETPVQADIAAKPGWKQAVGRRLDDLVSWTVPDVLKAVKRDAPFS
ncbi:hypothetical protein [Oceaniradius stylonematis]|uniref:hypothetical protein n=1 Tax=Oceaniradius stylonematis TaxID=2184161 RepID=UPI0026A74C0B